MTNKKFIPFYLIILVFILTAINSCSKDNNASDDDNAECSSIGGAANQLKSIQRSQDGNPTCYSYDVQNRLISINRNSYIIFYTYDGNENIISSYNQQNSGEIDSERLYEYDALQRLINYKFYDIEIEFSYLENIVSITRISPDGYPVPQELELNENGLVSKLVQEDGDYLVFSYDDVGNLISSQYFTSDEEPGNSTVFAYDSNPNPYYGLLNSIYLERFIDINGYFTISDIRFPYLPYNLTTISTVRTDSTDQFLSTLYEYNSENLPVYLKHNLSFESGFSEFFFNY
jgi:hypothetical protein